MMRVWLEGTKKTYVLVEPPYPAVGESLNMPDGSRLIVKKVREEEGFEVKFPLRPAKSAAAGEIAFQGRRP